MDDPVDAIIAAANHNGNSPITAALTGAIEGVRFGADFLPNYWKDLVEGEESLPVWRINCTTCMKNA